MFKKIFKFLNHMIRGTPQIQENKEENKEGKKIKSFNINYQNQETMAMFNYGVGGNEVKVDANEAIQEIQENKTLLVSKLTTEDTVSPEIVKGLKT